MAKFTIVLQDNEETGMVDIDIDAEPVVPKGVDLKGAQDMGIRIVNALTEYARSREGSTATATDSKGKTRNML